MSSVTSSKATSQPSKRGLGEWETAERDTVYILKLLSGHVAFFLPQSVARSGNCMSNDGQTTTKVLQLSLLVSFC